MLQNEHKCLVETQNIDEAYFFFYIVVIKQTWCSCSKYNLFFSPKFGKKVLKISILNFCDCKEAETLSGFSAKR